MAAFDRVADVYDATRSLPPDVMAKATEALLSQVRGRSVIDFGVGTGRFAAPLAAAGVRIVGVDVSTLMIRQALKKAAGDLALCDAGSVPFRDLSFDYALAVHFIHLVENWSAVVKEMARVARDGLLTLLDDQQEMQPREMFQELREKMGYPIGRLMGERDFLTVKPRLMEEVVRYQEMLDPPAVLAEYRRKLHSVTWDIPDDVNERIIGELARRLGGKRMLTRSLTLVGWSRGQLLELHPSI